MGIEATISYAAVMENGIYWYTSKMAEEKDVIPTIIIKKTKKTWYPPVIQHSEHALYIVDLRNWNGWNRRKWGM
jgi:hypothetical protein